MANNKTKNLMKDKKFGHHTPERTTNFCLMLEAAGIPFQDESWGNDETDRIVIKNTGLCVWCGDPEHPFEEYQNPALCTDDDEGKIIISGDFPDIITAIKERMPEPSLLERLNSFSDRQLDEIYYRTIGYCPIAEDNESRETVIEVLAGWEEESGEAPTIPDNIESFR